MPHSPQRVVARRGFLSFAGRAAGGLVAALTAGTPAEALADLLATPSVAEGPFYPDRLPLDTDNDLLVVNERTAPALGEVTHLTGRVLSRVGEPIRNAVVEIWQCDKQGSYLHSRGASRAGRDAGFQGYGRFLTDSSGAYYFRTIRPVAYGSRTPHIHMAVSRNGRRVLTTQLFVEGEPRNASDFLYRRVGDDAAKRLVTTSFTPIADASIADDPIPQHEARFDLVLGATPAEGDDGQFPGVLGAPRGGRRG
ncbi:MAG: protocatechuate 3,4-dioxygenase [Planctomycetota bacterium]